MTLQPRERKTFNLLSVPMMYTPGVVRWLQHLSPSKAHQLLRTIYPQLTLQARSNLYAGKYTVEGDKVVVEG